MRAAVVPVKWLDRVKTRLSPLLDLAQRQRLMLFMLDQTLHSLCRSGQLDEIFVITPDPRVESHVHRRHPGVRVILDRQDLDLNGSAAWMAGYLAERGFSSMLFVFGDLPLLRPEEVDRAARLSRRCAAVLMPDRRGTGTNALLLSPPGVMGSCFGQGSFLAHRREARRRQLPFAVFQARGFRNDVDTPEDYDRILAESAQDVPAPLPVYFPVPEQEKIIN